MHGHIQSVVKVQDMDQLLDSLSLNASDITGKLTELGSSIGLLGEGEKQECYNTLKGKLEIAQRGMTQKEAAPARSQMQELLRIMLDNARFVHLTLVFLRPFP